MKEGRQKAKFQGPGGAIAEDLGLIRHFLLILTHLSVSFVIARYEFMSSFFALPRQGRIQVMFMAP